MATHSAPLISIIKVNVKIFKGSIGGEAKVGSFGMAGQSMPAGAFSPVGSSVPDVFLVHLECSDRRECLFWAYHLAVSMLMRLG